MHCPEFAIVQAVEAVHAAAVINLMLFDIDAGSFAFALAYTAALAFVCIYHWPEGGKSG